jgi:Arylsulfotransferase (ASST)
MAEHFKEFTAGDLLVSVRNLNLLMVLDPETLHIKWWRGGLWRRQHDPDWQPTGEISLLDNRMDREYSRIVSIAPDSTTPKVLLDGRSNDFYTRIRGSHQLTPTGDLLVASTQQGRVFEVDASGKTVFEMYNTKPGGNQFNYPIADASWFASGAFDFAEDQSCAK